MSDSTQLDNPDLAALTAEASTADGIAAPMTPEGAAAEAQQQAAIVAEDQAAEQAKSIAGLLQMLAGIVSPMFPTVAGIYTQEVCQAVGGATAPVMVKYGWSVGGVMGKYAEELAMLGVVGPLAFVTYQAAKQDIAAMEAAAKEAPAATIAPPPPEEQTGQEGVDVPKLTPRA